jgi:hypothetical protein
MVSREVADPASRMAGLTGGLGAGAGDGRWGFWAVARDRVIGFCARSVVPCVRLAGRFAMGAGRLAAARLAGAPLTGPLTRAVLFGGRLEELTPELPDLAD